MMNGSIAISSVEKAQQTGKGILQKYRVVAVGGAIIVLSKT